MIGALIEKMPAAGRAREVLRGIADRRFQLLSYPLERKYRRAGLRERVADLPNASMFAWTGGRGYPLVLLHGFGPSALWQWYGQVGPFAERFRLVVPDLVYFGRSTSKRADFSPEFQAETVIQLLDHLGIRKFHALGLSYGGIVAYLLARHHHERLGKLVIVDSPGIPFVESDYNRALETFNAKTIQEIVMPEKPEDFGKLFDISLYRPPYVPRFILRDFHHLVFSTQWEEKSRVIDHLRQTTLKSEAEITCEAFCIDQETLFVWGRYDRLIPLEVGKRLARELGTRSRLAVIENARHTPNLEKPKEFNRLVLDFLKWSPGMRSA